MSTSSNNCSALIRRSEGNLKVATSVVKVLSEKYNFDFDEAWNSVCATSIKKLTKKFRQHRRRNGPYANLKGPRTAFCIYTQEKRNEIASENSDLSFADLSKKVGELWRGLNDKDRKHYKTLEEKDKQRYEKEKSKIDAELAKNPPQPTTEESDETTTKTTDDKPSPKTTKTKEVKSKTTETKSKPSFQSYKKAVSAGLKKKNPKLSAKELNAKMSETWKGLSVKQKSKYVEATA